MPEIIIMAGPNGAGKTTVALKILPLQYGKIDFVNADIIARGLSAFNTPSVDFEAGRIMLKRLHELRDSNKDFAFETTLSSKSFIPFLKECKSKGYKLTIIFVWLKEFSLAIDRVLERKKDGGHFIPDDIVKRRYERSRQNFLDIYMPLADEWKIYNNSGDVLRIVAERLPGQTEIIYDKLFYGEIMSKESKEPVQIYTGDRITQLAIEAIREELDRRHKLNLPIVFMEGDKKIYLEGKDYYSYLEQRKKRNINDLS